MEIENFDKLIRGLTKLQPFSPFGVELASGAMIEIDHPEAIVIRNGVAVYMRPDGVPTWFDHGNATRIHGETKKVMI